jgi:hypothetical protein
MPYVKALHIVLFRMVLEELVHVYNVGPVVCFRKSLTNVQKDACVATARIVSHRQHVGGALIVMKPENVYLVHGFKEKCKVASTACNSFHLYQMIGKLLWIFMHITLSVIGRKIPNVTIW